MKLIKSYKTIEEQHKILLERGMIIDNDEILNSINYSHLIYKYGIFYVVDKDDIIPTYKKGTKISHLFYLMSLNNLISKELYEAIGKIESQLKTSIAKVLSKINPLYHINLSLSEDVSWTTQGEINDFIENINRIERKSIKKYNKKYWIDSHMPIWLLVDELAFGQLRMLIKLSGKINQKNILANIGLYFNRDWKKLILINEYRNITHHYNPLVGKIPHNKLNLTLQDFLRIIKVLTPINFRNIEKIIHNFDFNLINITKEDFLDQLEIKKLF